MTWLWSAAKAALPYLLGLIKKDPQVRKLVLASVSVVALFGAFLAGRESKEDEWDRATARAEIARLEHQLRIERAAAALAGVLAQNLEALSAQRNEQVTEYELAFPMGAHPGRAATDDDVRRLCNIAPC